MATQQSTSTSPSELVDITVHIAFHSYHNLSKICTSLGGDCDIFWLSWTFLGTTYKSDEFRCNEDGPSRLKDVVKLQCQRPTSLTDGTEPAPNQIPKEVIAGFPFRIFLCSADGIIGTATVQPFRSESITDKQNIVAVTPFEIAEWIEIIPINPTQSDPHYFENQTSSSIRVSIAIYNEQQQQQQQQQEEDEEYDDDGFEAEEDLGRNPIIDGPKHVHFDEEEQRKRKAEEEKLKMERLQKQREEQEEQEQDQLLRHFRLSVDMRSVGGLKRPAHVALQYVYPYLGSSNPVRTKPTWVMAHTETTIDGGAASFECAMSRERLRQILTQHPLKVTALTRSHLGNNLLGEVAVDLAAVTFAEPHSYRCPLTSKMFKSMREYQRHRDIMMTLLAAGRVDHAPPKEPISIRALDTYLVFNSPTHETSKRSTGSSTPNFIVPLAEGGKLRTVVILEDIGRIGPESSVDVKLGYKMHNGGLYDGGIPWNAVTADDIQVEAISADDPESAPSNGGSSSPFEDPLKRNDLTPAQRKELEKLKVDWEAWRRAVDAQWKEAMGQKEAALRKQLEQENAEKLSERADDLKRAQTEAAKLEVRLRATIAEVEKQKNSLVLKDEQMAMRLAQKTAELQLLQRRVRDEAKERIESERRKNESLKKQLESTQESLRLMERRAKDAERDFENYRNQLRGSPESVLREETARLRAQLGEVRAEIERERRLRTETELEKEHFRSQMHRLALALKREREKSSVMARQDLEQLRLEFLAREERYVLDGDRDELRNIRNELNNLRNNVHRSQNGNDMGSGTTQPSTAVPAKPVTHNRVPPASTMTQQQVPRQLIESKLPSPESKEESPPRQASPAPTPKPRDSLQELVASDEARNAAQAVRDLKMEIGELLDTGLYTDNGEDAVIEELKKSLRSAEKRLANLTTRDRNSKSFLANV